jgi:Family of unknown function (DUF5990)
MDWQTMEVTLRIVLEQPTKDVDFGLQSGHGSGYEIAQKKRSKGKDLKFEFTVTAKPSHNDALPHFAGPFVQGPTGDKFVYINIGTYAGQTDTPWSRRLKIPLNMITWDMIKSERVLVVHIPGTGKDGGPSCASEWRKRVSPDWGWQLEDSRSSRR